MKLQRKKQKILLAALLAAVLLFSGCRNMLGEVDRPSDYQYTPGTFTINDTRVYDTIDDKVIYFGMYEDQVKELYGTPMQLHEYEGIRIMEYPNAANLRLYYREGRVARLVVNATGGDRFMTFRGLSTTSPASSIVDMYGEVEPIDGVYIYNIIVSGKRAGNLRIVTDPLMDNSISFIIDDGQLDVAMALSDYLDKSNEAAAPSTQAEDEPEGE